MLRFIIYVIIISYMFMGISLYMLHICVYCYFSMKLYIIECNCLFMFICKSSTRVLYVYVLDACSLKSKFMWHSSVEYWVCYRMFCSKRTKVFPRVAWPGLFKVGDVTKWYQSMRDCSGVAFPQPVDGQGNITKWYQSFSFNTEPRWA